jgi:hypothetical protein
VRDIIEARQPYLSVVMTTRNDDHGGDPLKRLQAFLATFAAQCRRSGLDAEVVVVEWNPPADRPRVADVCRVPADAPFAVRFIEVPGDVHRRLKYADVLPLFQMIAKNVGIRRARGRFILATNIDIILSNELVERLAAKDLRPGELYRVDRHDITADLPIDATLAEQMEYCRTHQLRLHTAAGTHAVDARGGLALLDDDIEVSRGVTLIDGWHVREGRPQGGYYRWARRVARFAIERSASGFANGAALDVEIEPSPYQGGSWVELEVRDGDVPLAHWFATRPATYRTRLADGVDTHQITLRLLDSSGGRDALPPFEYRDQLSYRIRRIEVHRPPVHDHDLREWERLGDDPALQVRHSDAAVDIVTAPGRYSAAAQYGPFIANEDASYEFLLDYEVTNGGLALSVLDHERQKWLPASVNEIEHEGARSLQLRVTIPRATTFSLCVSNCRPSPGVSRFVLRRLRGSVAPGELRRVPRPGALRRLVRRAAATVKAPWNAAAARVAAVERRRAMRFEDLMLDASDRVLGLEARVASLAPLEELRPIAATLRDHRPAELHQNTCGDFQLLAREHWAELRGYPEFEMFSMSLDGVFEAMACAAGLREVLLECPLCIFHLEHEKGSGWTPEGAALLRQRIAESGIIWLESQTVHMWTTYMHWLRRPMIFNSESWGMGDVVLPERTCTAPLKSV